MAENDKAQFKAIQFKPEDIEMIETNREKIHQRRGTKMSLRLVVMEGQTRLANELDEQKSK